MRVEARAAERLGLGLVQRHAVTASTLVGIVVLVAAWLLVPPHTVGLYDGLGFPDEPYRFVHPLAGSQHTPSPTSARTLIGNGDRQVVAMTAEQGPQITVRLAGGSLRLPSGATPTVLQLAPLASPSGPAVAGQIVTNVYQVSTAATLVSSGDSTIEMRAPTADQPGPTFEVLTPGGWQTRATTRVGNDIYQAHLDRFGDWALVRTHRVARNGQYDFGTPDTSGPFEAVLAIGGPVAIVAVVIIAIRTSRSHGRSRRQPRT